MEKSGLILKKFLGYLVVFTLFGLILRGGDYTQLPWHIYGPGALIFTLFDVYIRPRMGKKDK